MNRFALILTTLVLAGSGLQAASDTEANTQLIDRLQDRLASLETRVMQLEAALEKVPPAHYAYRSVDQYSQTPASHQHSRFPGRTRKGKKSRRRKQGLPARRNLPRRNGKTT